MTIKVLVVDDDRDVAESLGMVLEGLGCDVELVFTGEQAIEQFHHQRYDLTLLDVRLPGRNGVEVFRELRGIRPRCRVVFVTGYSAAAVLDQVEDLGAIAVLDKPVDMRRLRAILDNLAAG